MIGFKSDLYHHKELSTTHPPPPQFLKNAWPVSHFNSYSVGTYVILSDYKEVTAVRSAKATLQCASGISPFKQSYQDRNNQHALYDTSKHPWKLSMKWSRHKTTLRTFLLLQVLAIHLADFPTWIFYTHYVFNSPQGTFFFLIHLSNNLVNSFTLSFHNILW